MIAELHEQIGLAQGLIRAAADTADANQRPAPSRVRAVHLVSGNREYRSEEPDSWIADRELSRVYSDGETTAPGGRVVPGQGPLPLFVEPAILSQRERMRRNDATVLERSANRVW